MEVILELVSEPAPAKANFCVGGTNINFHTAHLLWLAWLQEMYRRDKPTGIFPCVYLRFRCTVSHSTEIKNGCSSNSKFSVDLLGCRGDTLPLALPLLLTLILSLPNSVTNKISSVDMNLAHSHWTWIWNNLTYSNQFRKLVWTLVFCLLGDVQSLFFLQGVSSKQQGKLWNSCFPAF